MKEETIFDLTEVKDRSLIIPFSDLSKSIRHEGKNGLSLETKPSQIWDVSNNISELLYKNNLNFSLNGPYIKRGSSYALLTDRDKKKGYNRYKAPINKWKFDKVLIDFNIPDINDRGVNANICITLNERGINIAFGLNVRVCSNFNVIGDTLYRTYTHNGVIPLPWETIMLNVSYWICELNQLFMKQCHLMNAMINTIIPHKHTINLIIGILYENAIRKSYFAGPDTPFDTHGLSNFVQAIINKNIMDESIDSIWDLYNLGTSVMKPSLMDIGDISNSSSGFCNFLCNEFDKNISNNIFSLS